jgi:predicted dehydrogenase
MLDQVEVDALYLAVPHHLHYGMMEQAINARIPVFVEKPITRTLDEAKKIVQLSKEQGVKIGVNYQYRYDSGCHRLARAVQKGELGIIHAVRINVPWHRKVKYFDNAPWHRRRSTAGGGTLITQGSHFLDILLWALQGDSPKTAVGYTAQRKFRKGREGVSKIIDVEDLAQAIIEMESGALVQISSSMVASSEQAVRFEVYGEKGTAIYSPSPWPRVKFRDVKVKGEKPPYRGVHALQRSLEGFRGWIMEDRPYLIPAQESLPALAVVEAIYRSAETEKREKVTRFS